MPKSVLAPAAPPLAPLLSVELLRREQQADFASHPEIAPPFRGARAPRTRDVDQELPIDGVDFRRGPSQKSEPSKPVLVCAVDLALHPRADRHHQAGQLGVSQTYHLHTPGCLVAIYDARRAPLYQVMRFLHVQRAVRAASDRTRPV